VFLRYTERQNRENKPKSTVSQTQGRLVRIRDVSVDAETVDPVGGWGGFALEGTACSERTRRALSMTLGSNHAYLSKYVVALRTRTGRRETGGDGIVNRTPVRDKCPWPKPTEIPFIVGQIEASGKEVNSRTARLKPWTYDEDNEGAWVLSLEGDGVTTGNEKIIPEEECDGREG
jgi:hypothetical protein